MVEVSGSSAGKAAGPSHLLSPLPSSLRRECYLVLLAGLYRAVVVFSYSCGRVLVIGVAYIPFVLMGGQLQARSVFTIISLAWPLVLNVYRHVLFALVEGTEAQVAASRIQVS